MVSMINHCIGNEEDNVKGRQMPVHYTYREGRLSRFKRLGPNLVKP